MITFQRQLLTNQSQSWKKKKEKKKEMKKSIMNPTEGNKGEKKINIEKARQNRSKWKL